MGEPELGLLTAALPVPAEGLACDPQWVKRILYRFSCAYIARSSGALVRAFPLQLMERCTSNAMILASAYNRLTAGVS